MSSRGRVLRLVFRDLDVSGIQYPAQELLRARLLWGADDALGYAFLDHHATSICRRGTLFLPTSSLPNSSCRSSNSG